MPPILLIFLDIDGVLNTHKTAKESDNLICEALVKKFNDFLEGKNIQIVISSSWRYDMQELKLQLEKVGFAHWSKVIGKTPTYKILTRRGEQINRWIDDNMYLGSMVIIDDEIHDIVTDVGNVPILQTDPKVGLSDGHIVYLEQLYTIVSDSLGGRLVEVGNEVDRLIKEIKKPISMI